MIKLSILICSINTRTENFLPNIYRQLNPQLTNEVEVLTIVDNKTMSIWEKRNRLLQMARWEYVVFIDDDDRISRNYVSELLKWIKSWKDVICFNVIIWINRWSIKLVQYSRNLPEWETDSSYTRYPNHIMCWKASIAKKIKYKSISYEEDSDRSKRALSKIKNEHHIDQVLYFYEYNEWTSESVKHKT